METKEDFQNQTHINIQKLKYNKLYSELHVKINKISSNTIAIAMEINIYIYIYIYAVRLLFTVGCGILVFPTRKCPLLCNCGHGLMNATQ